MMQYHKSYTLMNIGMGMGRYTTDLVWGARNHTGAFFRGEIL